jgi:acyl-[acyl carrier protein]--UDP-N-acetylglucosamine O-acyltransferase
MRLSDFFNAAEVVRDGEFAHLDEAASEEAGALVFCQWLEYLRVAAANANVSCVITKAELAEECGTKGVALAPDPRLAFFRIYKGLFQEGHLRPQMKFGIGTGARVHPSAAVSRLARIGNGVAIGANAVVEDYTVLGENTTIGPGAVIGAEGMLTIWDENRVPLVIPHAGGVMIGREVVVLAGAIVAKSLYRSPTTIADYCQIGILTTIGHGVRVGRRCVISGNSVVAGRAVIGDDVWVGASSFVAQGLRIGAGAQIKAGSVVVRDVPPGQAVSGNFARPHAAHVRDFFRSGRK